VTNEQHNSLYLDMGATCRICRAPLQKAVLEALFLRLGSKAKSLAINGDGRSALARATASCVPLGRLLFERGLFTVEPMTSIGSLSCNQLVRSMACVQLEVCWTQSWTQAS
jgi:hypothetical protein